jgi:predicted RNase H-like nuclease (RuvC/YqgF family)
MKCRGCRSQGQASREGVIPTDKDWDTQVPGEYADERNGLKSRLGESESHNRELTASNTGLQEEILNLKEKLELAKRNASSWIDKHDAMKKELEESRERAGQGRP